MAAVTSPARHAALLATSASNREPRRSKAHRAMEWPKPSSARSSVTMSASVRVRMRRPSCTSYQLGSITTTRFTRTRHSDIVHPVSSSQLTEARDRVRSFGGYNTNEAYTAAHAIAGFQLADIAFGVLVRNGILPKSEAERLLKQAIAGNRETQASGNLAAAELLAIVLQNLSKFQPAFRQ